jgi:hypothetical protein
MRRIAPSSTVISEMIDGEVVMINLATGVYYSLRDVAGALWALVERGATAEELVAWANAAYDGDLADIENAIGEFVALLSDDGLVTACDSDGTALAVPADDGHRPAFRVPVIEKFTDMHHVIQMDPIHDVDLTRGWPHAVE